MIGKRKIKRLVNQELCKTSWYANLWNGVEKFWNFHSFNLDIVNLGSGAGYYAFNYEDSGVKGSNWALWPQSLEHDFNILKNYFSFIKPYGHVIITACPFGCLFSPSYNHAHNLKYYTFLHPATIINFEEDERVKALLLKERPLDYLGIQKSIRKIIKNKLTLEEKHEVSESYVDNAQLMVEGWKEQFGIDDLDAPIKGKHVEEFHKRQNLLREIIQFCIERDLKPVIVYPPIHPSLSILMSNEFRKQYIYDFIEGAIQGLNCSFYEYINHDMINTDDLFRTSYFLNTNGAKKFTQQLLNQLELSEGVDNQILIGGGNFVALKRF